MVELNFYIFLSISFLFVIVLIYQKQNYKQFHWLFIVFMFMYNVFPILNYMGIKPSFVRINMDLTYNVQLLTEQLIISYLSIFLYMMLLIFKKNTFIVTDETTHLNNMLINPKILFILFYPITIYLVIYYPWPEHGDVITFGNSLAAYAKNMELVLLIMVLVRYKNSRLIFFILYMIIILIDTQRTPLLVALIAYLSVSDAKKAVRYTLLAIFGIIVLSIIAIYRNGVDISFINMLYPFYNEGIFGSYCILQSLDIVHHYDYTIFTSLKLLLSPVNDIIVKIIPNIYFNLFGTDKQNFYILSSFIGENIDNGNLTEAWTPMGGFFYPAESNLMIPYLGPILFTGGLFFLVKKISAINNTALRVLLFSNMFLYIKANIFIATKYIIFLLFAYFSILIFDKIFKIFLSQYIIKRSQIENIN